MIYRAIIPVVVAALITTTCSRSGDDSVIAASGHVEATEIRLSSKVGGPLQSLALQEGDSVKTGDVIARIDPTDINLAIAATRAERDQAAAELRLRLAGARAEDIAEAEAQVARAQADLDGAQKDLARMQELLDGGVGTPQGRDDARTRRDMAASQLDAAHERLTKLRAGNRPEEIDSARARVAAAEARVAQLEQQLSDATIKCPATGIVTEKLAEPGELLAAGAAIAVIADLAHAWLTVYIGEPDLGRIRLGQVVDVITDAGERRKGTITYVSSKAEFTPKNVQTREERVKLVYRIKIALENDDGLFKPGMPAEARIAPEQGAR